MSYNPPQNLSENRLGTEGAEIVFQSLKTNKTLQDLDLSGNYTGDCIGLALYSLLTVNKTLKCLNLKHNKLGDGAAQWLSRALKENKTLDCLDISWNLFRSKGCVDIAKGLQKNNGLKEVNVAMNGFGGHGGKALGEAIQANRSLLRLDASYCRLPSECAEPFGLGLFHNTSLIVIDISNNVWDADGAYILLSSVSDNSQSNLFFLKLGKCQVSPAFKELQDKLREERGVHVDHGGIVNDFTQIDVLPVDPWEAYKKDPFTKVQEWRWTAGYRLVDLFYYLNRKQKTAVSMEELRQGISRMKLPLKKKQIRSLMSRLDKDKNGYLDFSELIEGDKEHRRTKREIEKHLQKAGENAKREKKHLM